jgi:hypothetical protein
MRYASGLVEALLPPQVEFRRLRGIGAIFAQLVQWLIKPGHFVPPVRQDA